MKSLSVLLLLGIIFIHSRSNAQDCGCPENKVVTADAGKEGANVSFSHKPAPCEQFTYTPASGSFFRFGSHSIIATAPSGKKCTFTLTVTDNESPTLSPITLSRLKIWPASNKMKKVKVSYTVSDNAEQVKTAITVKSNAAEPSGDWEIVDDHLIRLKSSRLPDGSPRIYTITVTATDEAGNKTIRTTTVAVSSTMVAKPLVTK